MATAFLGHNAAEILVKYWEVDHVKPNDDDDELNYDLARQEQLALDAEQSSSSSSARVMTVDAGDSKSDAVPSSANFVSTQEEHHVIDNELVPSVPSKDVSKWSTRKRLL